MSQPINKLFSALRKKAGFEVVSHNESANQLRLLGRIPDDAFGLNSNNWKIVKYRLLEVMEDRSWKVDLSKSYFIKKETKKMVFAWRVLFQGEGIANHYEEIAHLIEFSPSARSEVLEVPLPGAGADRNNTAGGRRGAGPVGTVPVGPMALQRKMMGG